MKRVKSMNCNINSRSSIYNEHTIYELSNEEMRLAGTTHKYMLDQTYCDWAMKNMDLIDVIKKAIRESEYVYGIAFADTIEEAELKYQNAVLTCRIKHLQQKMSDIMDQIESSKQDICFQEV